MSLISTSGSPHSFLRIPGVLEHPQVSFKQVKYHPLDYFKSNALKSPYVAVFKLLHSLKEFHMNLVAVLVEVSTHIVRIRLETMIF